MFHKLNVSLIGCVLLSSLAIVPVIAQTQQTQEHRATVTYHDKRHNDDHEWNDHENQAYQMWTKEKKRKDVEFTKIKPADQQSYWDWRHTHSDATLKIDVR